MSESTTDLLNKFLRGELSAVETYDLAIKQTKNEGFGSALLQLRSAHAARVNTIREKILSLGGAPETTSGAWGTFATAVQASADLFGNTTALSALEEGEDHGLAMYRDALKDESGASVREFVSSTLMPEQKQSHDLCRSLKKFVQAS